MLGVEIGEPAVGLRVVRILRQTRAYAASEHGRNVVNRFRERIRRQESETFGHAPFGTELHGVIRTGGGRLYVKDGGELRVRRQTGGRVRLIQIAHVRQVRALGSHVCQIHHPVRLDFILQVHVPLLHVSIPEVARDHIWLDDRRGRLAENILDRVRAAIGVIGQIVKRRVEARKNVDIEDAHIVEDPVGGAHHPAFRLQGPPGDPDARGEVG